MKNSSPVKPKAILFGYHDMGFAGLNALLESHYEVISVFTHSDSAEENIFFNSVSQLAQSKNIPFYSPEDINTPEWIARIKNLAPDYLFTLSYRQPLCPDIVSAAKSGAFNIHASLLPAHRGRAHLNWAIIKDDQETGITLHQINGVPDAGPIFAQLAVLIEPNDSAWSLHKKVTGTAAEVLPAWLNALRAGKLTGREQDESKATCYGQRKPEDGKINWDADAREIHNLIRALSFPWPGAFTTANRNKLIIRESRIDASQHELAPGTVISVEPLRVACGRNSIEVLNGAGHSGEQINAVQLAGKFNLEMGTILG